MPTDAEDTDRINEFSIYTGPEHEQTLADTCRSLPAAAATKSEDADDQPQNSDTCSDAIYYFGVGPIVNPIVRQRQHVQVSNERAAILPEYRITFVVGGIANVVPGHGCEVHGILMRFDSPEGWESYRDQNAGSNKVLLVNVHPYDEPDRPIRSNVFVQEGLDVNNDTPIETPAQERYLKLIAQGLRQYKADEEYIEYQIMSVPFVPSRKPADYLKFPCKTKDEKSLPSISFTKYEKLCQDSSKKYHFVIGEFVFEMPVDNPQNPGAQWVLSQCHGKRDATWYMYNLLVDPDVPVVSCESELTQEHTRWAEDMSVEFLNKCNLSVTKCYRLVNDDEQGGSGGGLCALFCCRMGCYM